MSCGGYEACCTKRPARVWYACGSPIVPLPADVDKEEFNVTTNYRPEILRMVKAIKSEAILRKLYRLVRMMYRVENAGVEK